MTRRSWSALPYVPEAFVCGFSMSAANTERRRQTPASGSDRGIGGISPRAHDREPGAGLASARIEGGRIFPSAKSGRLPRARRDWQVELPSHFGILSSLEDLIRWEIALGSHTLLKKTALARMWTPAKIGGGLDALV